MIKQYTYTSTDSTQARRGGWQVKDNIGLDEQAEEAEVVFMKALRPIEPLADVPLLPNAQQREELPARLTLTDAADGVKRLAQERPAGTDASGRRGNSFTHVLIAPLGELAEQISLPIRAYKADWWLTPYGAEEVREANLDGDISLSPSFLPDDWMELLPLQDGDGASAELEFLRQLLNEVQATVQARLSGNVEERKLVVLQLDDLNRAPQWLELLQALMIVPDAWQMNFSTFERRVRAERATDLLRQGFDVVCSPSEEQGVGGRNVVVFKPGSGAPLPVENQLEQKWGDLFSWIAQKKRDASSKEELFMNIESLTSDATGSSKAADITPSSDFGWGFCCALLNEAWPISEAQMVGIRNVLVWNAPPILPAHCPAQAQVQECVKSEFDKADNPFALYPRVLGGEPSETLEMHTCSRLLERALENPELLLSGYPYAGIPPTRYESSRDFDLRAAVTVPPPQEMVSFYLAVLALVAKLGFPVSENVKNLMNEFADELKDQTGPAFSRHKMMVEALPETYQAALAESLEVELANCPTSPPMLSPYLSIPLHEFGGERLKKDLAVAVTARDSSAIRDRSMRSLIEQLRNSDQVWQLAAKALQQSPTSPPVEDATRQAIVNNAKRVQQLLALLNADPTIQNDLTFSVLIEGYDPVRCEAIAAFCQRPGTDCSSLERLVMLEPKQLPPPAELDKCYLALANKVNRGMLVHPSIQAHGVAALLAREADQDHELVKRMTGTPYNEAPPISTRLAISAPDSSFERRLSAFCVETKIVAVLVSYLAIADWSRDLARRKRCEALSINQRVQNNYKILSPLLTLGPQVIEQGAPADGERGEWSKAVEQIALAYCNYLQLFNGCSESDVKAFEKRLSSKIPRNSLFANVKGANPKQWLAGRKKDTEQSDTLGFIGKDVQNEPPPAPPKWPPPRGGNPTVRRSSIMEKE